jgi:4-amino-4-deoxy-L-arabinose transferase-like glycosyltransferase
MVLGVVSLVGLFVGLDRIDWTDAREARDAWIARDLVQRRELLTPALGGVPRFEKPLLAYAVEAATAAVTPGSPVGPRAFKAALAVLLVGLTVWIGARHLGSRAGLIGGAILATSLALPIATRSTALSLGHRPRLARMGRLAPIALGRESRTRLLAYRSWP